MFFFLSQKSMDKDRRAHEFQAVKKGRFDDFEPKISISD